MSILRRLRFKSITHRLIAGCIFAVLLIYGLSAAHMHRLIHDTTLNWLTTTGRYWVDALVTDLDRSLEGVARSAAVLVASGSITEQGVISLLQQQPLLSAVALADTHTVWGWQRVDGLSVLSAPAVDGLLARCEQAPLSTPGWTAPYIASDAATSPAMSYCLPLDDARTLVLELNLAWLDERIALRLTPEAIPEELASAQPFAITQGDGQWLLRPSRMIPTEWLVDLPPDATILPGAVPVQVHQNAQRLLLYSHLADHDWLLGLAFPRTGIDQLESRYIVLMLQAMLRDMLLICVAVALISRRTTHSLRALISNTEDIARGDLDTTLPDTPHRDEVGRLTRAFGHMRDALKTHISKLQETTAARQRLESELDIAGQIQRDMVPRVEILQQTGRPYELSALLQPARQVGGDFYDFFPLEDQRLCLIIGDVAGKGVPAALLMARTVTLIRASARQTESPVGILAAVNRELCQNNEECRFVTVFCGVLDLHSGQLDYASSGHDPPLLLRGATVSLLDLDTGPPLGLDEEAQFPGYHQALVRDDLLLLYTDGLTEAMNPQQEIFTETRLQQVLAAQGTGTPARLIRSLQYHLKQFVQDAPPSDDLTLLALQYLPSCPFPLESRRVEWKIRINSELTEIARLKERLGELLQSERLAVECIEDALLIVEEVVANILQHAEGMGAEDFIDLRLQLADERLRLRFEDQAAPFNPLSLPPVDLAMDDDERALGGLGFFLVQELAEHLDYAYQQGKNILTVQQIIRYRP